MAQDPIKGIPTSDSDAATWKQWHIALRSRFGRKTANAIYIHAWNKRGNKDIMTGSAGHDLHGHLKKSGIILDKGLVGTITEAGADVFDGIGDFMKVGKYVVYALLGITVVGVGMIIFNIAKNPIKAAQAGAAFTPAGRAGAMAGAIK